MPEMHLILTAVYRDGTRLTWTSTLLPRAGVTRAEVLADTLAQLAQRHGHPGDVAGYTPVFFSVEPNQIPGA